MPIPIIIGAIALVSAGIKAIGDNSAAKKAKDAQQLALQQQLEAGEAAESVARVSFLADSQKTEMYVLMAAMLAGISLLIIVIAKKT